MKQQINNGAYKILKPWFMKQLYIEQSRRINHKDLVCTNIVDKYGHTYYEFPESMALPMVRFVKEKEFMEYMASGLDAENLTEIVETAKGCLMKALELPAKSKPYTNEMAKVAALLNEIGERKERIVPFDLIINCLCGLLIREDENPYEWNEAIHREKCEYFSRHYLDYGFFFQFTAFRKLSKLLNVSKENWAQYLAGSRTQSRFIKEAMKSFSIEKE